MDKDFLDNLSSKKVFPEGFEFYHLRIHYEDICLSELVDFIKSRSMVVLIVRETDANRPHIHCVILDFKQTKSTFFQQLKKQYPMLKGNKSYSCEKKNQFPQMVQYCLKGKAVDVPPDVVYYDAEYVDPVGGHLLYWEVNSLLKAKSKEGNMGSQKDTSLVLKAKSKTWTEKVYDEIKELYPADVMAIQQYQKEFIHSDYETKEERKSRITLYCYFKKRLGPKKQSDYILRDMFTGIISGLIQEADPVIANKYNEIEYNRIFATI